MKLSIAILFNLMLWSFSLSGQAIPASYLTMLDQEVGVWVADNSRYMSDSEPFDAYALEWSYGINHKSITGRLYGLKDGLDKGTLWQFRKYWDPSQDKPVLAQYSGDGTMGTGAFTKHSHSHHEIVQTFVSPGGTPYKIGHRTDIKSDSVHVGLSYTINDKDEWTLNRSYTWKKQSDSSNNVNYNPEIAQKYGADEYGMRKYVMAFLYRGPNTVPEKEAAQLQAAHLKNIQRMAKEGKLSLAGPFFDNGELRGIYIFNVTSIKEAEALTNTDPAIKAGTLRMDLKEWYGSAALMGVNELSKSVTKKSITD